ALRSDSARAEDQRGRSGEELVRDALIEDAAPDFLGSDGDVLRRGQEEGHRVLRDRYVVRPRVAADDHAGREALERKMIDAGEDRLDQSEVAGLISEVDRELPRESRGDEDLRGRPGLVPAIGGQVLQDDRLEGTRRLPDDDLPALRVHRDREQDSGHWPPEGAAGLVPFD